MKLEKELRQILINALSPQKVWERNDALKAILKEIKKSSQ